MNNRIKPLLIRLVAAVAIVTLVIYGVQYVFSLRQIPVALEDLESAFSGKIGAIPQGVALGKDFEFKQGLFKGSYNIYVKDSTKSYDEKTWKTLSDGAHIYTFDSWYYTDRGGSLWPKQYSCMILYETDTHTVSIYALCNFPKLPQYQDFLGDMVKNINEMV